MWRVILMLVVTCLALQAEAVVVDAVYRETSYWAGLEQPDLLNHSVTSTSIGTFNEAFSDTVTSPGYGDAGIGVSQASGIDLSYGTLSIQVTADASNFATSLVSGAIADSLSWTELSLTFTATQNVYLSVDLVTSSNLTLFYDGPGVEIVETSHLGSLLICEVGGLCFVDVLVDDLTDNGLGVSDGVLDAGWFSPGQYTLELLAVSQSTSGDVGSAAGGSGFSGTITATPAPEPSTPAMLAAGVALLALLRRR